jgi:hypothetical protein
MTQEEVMNFLEKHKGEFFSAKQIIGVTGLGQASVYHCMSRIARRAEISIRIVPSNKFGRGSNVITIYGYTGGMKDE